MTQKRRILILALLLAIMGGAVLWVRYPHIVGFGPSCPFHRLTGIPCPGCGGVRATETLMKGHILEALYVNPVSIAFEVVALIGVAWFAFDTLRGKDTLLPILRKPWSPTLTIVILSVIVLNWAWTIYKEFWGA